MSKDKDIQQFIRDMESRKDSTPADGAEVGNNPLAQVWDMSGKYQGNFSPDPDAAWQRFKSARAKENKQAPMRVVSRSPYRQWWSYAAAVLLLIGGWSIWRSNFRQPEMIAVQSMQELRSVQLADGTNVLLNTGSQLRYPANINSASIREVELSGEAYFDVAHDEGRQFVIRTAAADVAVLGTAFNLRAIPGESTIEVEVEEGSVELRPSNGSRIARIHPKQRGVFDSTSGISINKEPSLNAHAWRTGKLVFVGRPVKDAVREIGRYYGAHIDLTKSGIADCPFTSNFDKVPLSRALDALSSIYGASVEQQDATRFVIKGGKCSR